MPKTEAAGTDIKQQQVTLANMHFSEANAEIRHLLKTYDTLSLKKTLAQRYLGCGLGADKELRIYGVPGNDLGCYLDGGTLEVFGNAQDQVGNTMNKGRIIIHGNSGDAAGYGMRGGQIFIKGTCGWRVGVHMKQYMDKCPTIVIGQDAGSFLGEYMAGGVIVLLGKAGDYLATGMYGGVIYLTYNIDEKDLPEKVVCEEIDSADMSTIKGLLTSYNSYFADELKGARDVSGKGFYRIRPEQTPARDSRYTES
jgi:glutamate synthase domain-containing protein 3